VRKRDQTAEHREYNHFQPPGFVLHSDHFLQAIGINVAVVNCVPHCIQPFLIWLGAKALMNISVGPIRAAHTQRMARLRDEAWVHE
jgi:hypothetical protein